MHPREYMVRASKLQAGPVLGFFVVPRVIHHALLPGAMNCAPTDNAPYALILRQFQLAKLIGNDDIFN
jgi:hypothetical protein